MMRAHGKTILHWAVGNRQSRSDLDIDDNKVEVCREFGFAVRDVLYGEG
jgi:hypothetical protein